MRTSKTLLSLAFTCSLLGAGLAQTTGCSSGADGAEAPTVSTKEGVICQAVGPGCGSSGGSSGGPTCGTLGGACCPATYSNPNGSCGGDADCINGVCTECGIPGQRACSDGCYSGNDVNGTCVACGALGEPACSVGGCPISGTNIAGTCQECSAVTVKVFLASPDPESIAVGFQVAQPVQLLITATNAANAADVHTFVTGTGTTGTQAITGLIPSATYRVSVSIYETSCAPWTGTVATQKDSVTFSSGYMSLPGNGGDGWATLTIASDGTWTYAGHAHAAGLFTSDFSLAATTVWRDASGTPIAEFDAGELAGTTTIENLSRDADFSFGGTDPRLAANYLQIKPLNARFTLTMSTDIVSAIADSAAELGISLAAAAFGGTVASCFTNNQSQTECSVTASGDNSGGGADLSCKCSFQ